MKLSTRLILLILGCLLPILTAQIYSQINLYAARKEQLSELALRHAALGNAGMGSIINAVRQLGSTLLQFPEALESPSSCDQRLSALRQTLPQYRFLAVYRTDGGLLCGSAQAPDGLAPGNRPWMTNLVTNRDLEVGPLVALDGTGEPFLPVSIRIPSLATDAAPRILVAALDAQWISKHLDGPRFEHSQAMSHASLTIAGRDGVVIARLPRIPDAVGKPLPDWLRRLVNQEPLGEPRGEPQVEAQRELQGEPEGVATVTDPQGRSFIAAYVANVPPSAGITVIETMALPDVTADIDWATEQDLAIIFCAAIIALTLAWIAGRRFICQPTEALLLAARKWREGDLTARAKLTDPSSEFSALAQSFNAMAAGLQAREVERRLQSSFLEAQVAERTRALSETNNRLQVEIAGREKTEAALHQAQKLQAVGQLAGGIAHDFNNMLATVLGNLELMERRISQTEKMLTAGDSDRLMRLITRATGAVHRGSQLTSRLLAFSRRQRIAARPTDINALLKDLVTLASSTLGRRVQVVAELAEDLFPALVDPSQVEAAILNLCLNARDAMPEGGKVLISTTNFAYSAKLSADAPHNDLQPGYYIRVCISDTGVGMSPEVKARAFEPFYTTKGPAGSGLGLSQVYGMARQAGGDVTIDSVPGKGTQVTLYLPRAARVDQASAQTLADNIHHDRLAQVANDLVLIVDDDNEVRQVTVEMTRDLGCDVAQAASGDQALALIDKLSPSPSVILLDYAMPGMNGLQLARALRGRGITAPIALVTGYAELSETDIAAGQLAGLLRKPFTIQELRQLLIQLRTVRADQSAEGVLEPGLS